MNCLQQPLTSLASFYFASQVTPEGEPVQYEELSGEAHGNAYWDIVQRGEQGSWQVTFGPDAKEYGKLE